MKTIRIQAGQRKKIIGRFSNSIPTTYRFSVTTTSDNQQPSGTIEVKGSNWLFPKPLETQALQAENSVSKTMWDTFFSVYVTPDQDVSIALEAGQINRAIVFVALAAGVVVIAATLLLFGMA